MTMVNQPACWAFWIHDCDYVTFDKVKVLSNVNYPNNDGIHLNCSRNVTISNCTLVNGDDCIIVRCNNSSLKEDKITERIVVTNCTLTSYASCVLIGFTNCGTIRNCTFSNLVMYDCCWGISVCLKYIDPKGTGIGSADLGRNETFIDNISFSNILIDKATSAPVKLRIDDEEFVKCKSVQNMYFNNVHARGPEFPYIKGREQSHFKNIHFTDCTFEMTDGSEFENRWDRPSQYGDAEHHPMTLRYVDGLYFNNTQFKTL